LFAFPAITPQAKTKIKGLKKIKDARLHSLPRLKAKVSCRPACRQRQVQLHKQKIGREKAQSINYFSAQQKSDLRI